MPVKSSSPRPAWVSLTIGVCLWGAATGLLMEEAFHAHRFDVATMATPILTAATVASACLAHNRFASWRLFGGLGFTLLALLGSLVMATGTLGRLAEAKDGKQAGIQAANRTYGNKADDLKAAKIEQAKECKSIGPKCKEWNARIDQLTAELSGIVVKSTDPKAESIARLAKLIGGNGDKTREIVEAFDPVLLPLFLEFGSVGFFAGAFRHRKHEHFPPAPQGDRTESMETLASLESVNAFPFTREQALADLRKLKTVGSQKFLADRWGVSEGQVSKLMAQWERDGQVDRTRTGKTKAATLALPPPEPARRRLGHMARLQ